MKTQNAPLSSRSSFYRFTFLCLSFRHLVRVKQIIEGSLEVFSETPKKMWLFEYRIIVNKYHDFYHCPWVMNINSPNVA